MPCSGHHLVAAASALQLVLALRLVSCSSRAPPPPRSPVSGDVVAYSFPAFDDRMGADGLVVATGSSILSLATFLFDAQLYPDLNRSEGFLLLSHQHQLQLWRAVESSDDDDSGQPILEASFNTSFTVDGASAAVSFVVLLDSFPPQVAASPAGLRGSTNSSTFARGSAVPNASDSFSAVEVGAVGSYRPESPDVGLNVTVTPNGRSATVWIEYSAVAHHLWVYVADAGDVPRPLEALLDTPLNLSSRCTTQSAFVGFYSAAVRDAIHGVRGWRLTADRVIVPAADRGGESGSMPRASWLVILLAALGSVMVATAGVVTVVVCYFQSRRRELEMERMMKQIRLPSPSPTRRGAGLVSQRSGYD